MGKLWQIGKLNNPLIFCSQRLNARWLNSFSKKKNGAEHGQHPFYLWIP